MNISFLLTISMAYKLRMKWRQEVVHLPTFARVAAFTLIELSIVLVIIGLIVGGVLVGQDLIAAAKVRATVQQLQNYRTAVVVFKDKYGDLPGDLRNAERFGFETADTSAYSILGDRFIGAPDGPADSKWSASKETTQFWRQLYLAELIEDKIEDPGTGNCCNGHLFSEVHPKSKLRENVFWVVYTRAADGMYYNLRGLSNTGGTYLPKDFMTPREAFALDTKWDDGMPNTGKVKSSVTHVSGNYIFQTGASSCITSGAATGEYKTQPSEMDDFICTGLRIEFW